MEGPVTCSRMTKLGTIEGLVLNVPKSHNVSFEKIRFSKTLAGL